MKLKVLFLALVCSTSLYAGVKSTLHAQVVCTNSASFSPEKELKNLQGTEKKYYKIKSPAGHEQETCYVLIAYDNEAQAKAATEFLALYAAE